MREAATPAQILRNLCTCPITMEVMQRPATAADGFNYEALAIDAWLGENGRSPMTGLPLLHLRAVPNRSLAAACRELRQWEADGAPAGEPRPTAASDPLRPPPCPSPPPPSSSPPAAAAAEGPEVTPGPASPLDALTPPLGVGVPDSASPTCAGAASPDPGLLGTARVRARQAAAMTSTAAAWAVDAHTAQQGLALWVQQYRLPDGAWLTAEPASQLLALARGAPCAAARRDACRYLAQVAEPSGLLYLLTLAEDDDPDVRPLALALLAAAPAILDWLADTGAEVDACHDELARRLPRGHPGVRLPAASPEPHSLFRATGVVE